MKLSKKLLLLFFYIFGAALTSIFCQAKEIKIQPVKKLLKEHKDIEYIKVQSPIKLAMKCFPIASSKNSTYEKPLIPEAFILKIPNGRILGDRGLVIINNQIIKELVWPWSPIKRGDEKLNSEKLPNLCRINQTIATVTQEGHDNYYHWIAEIIPKLIVLKNSGIHYDLIYLPELRYQFMKDSLKIIGIDQKKIVEGYKNTFIKAPKVIAPSFVSRSCYSPKWVLDMLRSQFLTQNQNKTQNFTHPKIFISREKAPTIAFQFSLSVIL